ncbi:MAG: hypothetical protein ACO27F_15210 [Beijerinckiaceae bacterium]|jgi:hypothetical protein
MSADAILTRASIALMALAVARLYVFPPDVEAPVTAPSRAPTQPVAFEDGSSRSLIASIVARPLFDPNRRAAKAPVDASPPEAAEEASSLALVGVVITRRFREALISEGSGRATRAGLDEQIDGWTIVAIEPRSVTLDNGATRRVLTLRRPAAAGNEEGPDE